MQIKWVKLLERKAKPLIVYTVAVGRKWYPETLGVNFRPKNIKYINGWYYFDADEMKKESLEYQEIYRKESRALSKLADRIRQKAEELTVIAKESCKNLKTKSKNELGKSFLRYNDALEKFMPAVWSFVVIERLLSEQLKKQLKRKFPNLKEDSLDEYFSILTTLPEQSSATKEYKSLLKVAIEYKKSGSTAQVEKKIKQIYNKFYYLGAVRVGWTYLAKPYNLTHYKTMVKDLAKGSPQTELKELQGKRKKAKKIYKNFINQKEIDKEIIRDAEILQKYIFLRTARGERIVQSMVYIQKLLKEIALRLNLKLEDIAWFTPKEIAQALKTNNMPDFNSRKSNFVLEVIDGKPTVTVKKKLEKKQKEKIIKSFKGTIACLGKAKGKVKIIKTNDDIAKFKKGEVLVASMTRPDMIMAIRKTKAIVTDEGGVTCHAAIVSREFKIPCIIGTKIATKVLKNGNLIEVNANAGVVRKL